MPGRGDHPPRRCFWLLICKRVWTFPEHFFDIAKHRELFVSSEKSIYWKNLSGVLIGTYFVDIFFRQVNWTERWLTAESGSSSSSEVSANISAMSSRSSLRPSASRRGRTRWSGLMSSASESYVNGGGAFLCSQFFINSPCSSNVGCGKYEPLRMRDQQLARLLLLMASPINKTTCLHDSVCFFEKTNTR